MSRWTWVQGAGGEPVVFDAVGLRFLRLGAAAAQVLRRADEGMPADQIAEVLNVPRGPVLSILRDAGSSAEPGRVDGPTIGPLTKLSLHVSHVCNLRCTYCYADGGDYGQGPSMMSGETAIAAIAEMERRFGSIRTIQFFGGEPLLNWPVILTVCEHVNRQEEERPVPPYLGLVTNLIHYPRELEELVRQYRIHVTVSLDGPSEINDVLRVFPDGRGTFDRVAANIRRLRASTGEPTMLEATFTRRHAAEGWTAVALRRFFEETFGIRTTLVAPAWEPEDPDGAFHLLPLLCEQAGSPAPGVDEQGTVDPGGLIRMVPLILRRRSPYWCGAGLSALTVTPKGDIYPCHLFLSHSEYQVGNVSSGTWDDRVVDRLRSNKKPNDPVCRACDVDWACTGCIGGALNARGNVNPRYPQFCAAVRENATRTLQQCAELVTGGEGLRKKVRDTLEECFAPR